MFLGIAVNVVAFGWADWTEAEEAILLAGCTAEPKEVVSMVQFLLTNKRTSIE